MEIDSTKEDQKKPPAEGESQPEEKLNKKGKKKKNKKNLSDPMKIIKEILDKSSFKEANLSELVRKKFYEAEDYRHELRSELSEIVYESTIASTENGDCFNVLPLNFKGRIVPNASAIMSLPSITEVQKSRHFFRRQKHKKVKKQ